MTSRWICLSATIDKTWKQERFCTNLTGFPLLKVLLLINSTITSVSRMCSSRMGGGLGGSAKETTISFNENGGQLLVKAFSKKKIEVTLFGRETNYHREFPILKLSRINLTALFWKYCLYMNLHHCYKRNQTRFARSFCVGTLAQNQAHFVTFFSLLIMMLGTSNRIE